MKFFALLAALLILTVAVGVFGWMLFDPREYFVEVYTHPVAVQPGAKTRAELIPAPPIRPGNLLLYWREICFTRFYARGTIAIVIEQEGGPFTYRPPLVSSSTGSRGCFKRVYSVWIPLDTPPGRYVMSIDFTLPINPVRVRIYHLSPVRFEVQEN